MVDEAQRPDTAESADSTGAGGAPEANAPAPVARRRRSIMEDKRVRAMSVIAFVVFVGYLMSIAFALYFGFLGAQSPRTYAERDLTGWESAVKQENADLDQYQSYVLSLITAGQYSKATDVIKQVNANEKLDQNRGFQMLYVEAELKRTQGDTAGALKLYEQVIEKTEEAYQTEFEEGGEFQNWAVAYGRHQNHFLAALGKGIILRDQKKYEEALEMFDLYLSANPRQAGILVDRGDIKAALGDKKGAEEDYRLALQFIPDYEEALEGLKKIGVDK